MRDVRRHTATTELFQSLATHFFAEAEISLAANGMFNVAISGGLSPLPFFRLLASRKNEINDWSRVNFFWVDERWESIDHPDNNFAAAMRAGLRELNAKYFPFDTSLVNPDEACRAYERSLHEVFHQEVRMNWTLLGCGTDGHTASIFQSDISSAISAKYTLVTHHPVSLQTRLTVTFPLIFTSSKVLVLMTGVEKREMLSRVLDSKAPTYPIDYVMAYSKSPVVYTDINV